MALIDIPNELVAGCRESRAKENLDKLYAPDAVSVKAADPVGMGREVKGVEGIKGKHGWWEGAFEVLDLDASDPYPHCDDEFSVRFSMKTKNKETGDVQDFDEIAVYHVRGGKIFREEFFFSLG